MKNLFLILLTAMSGLMACNSPDEHPREILDLRGTWQFALDTADVGMEQEWFVSRLRDTIHLPGTTDTNHRGFLNKDTTSMHLNRIFSYEGPAWYRKEVLIPETFRDKQIQLILERTKSSTLWIDGILVGGSHLLQSPQQFNVTDYMSPGTHFITVRVNNDLGLTPFGNVHIYSEDTQTNWNGMLGQLYLEASDHTCLSNIQVYPDIGQQKIEVVLDLVDPMPEEELTVELRVEKTAGERTTRLKTSKSTHIGQGRIKLEYVLGEACQLWDEYDQALYRLTAVVSGSSFKDSRTVDFGMREFSVDGTQFTINGRKTFLRGKHDAAVFPLTGFPPMNVADWTRVFRVAKSYGINHYRFHSYCPPEAAFTAADREGIYLQAELPFWGGLESDTVADMLREEGEAMLKVYGNHPSFVLFSPGNEIWGGHQRVEQLMLSFKASDSRHLYTMGSNNNIGYLEPMEYCDFFVGARIPDRGDTTLGHTRLTHAFADAWQGGILNTRHPSTEVNFDYAVSHMKLPLISHEIGQYQIFPDYSEIKKYTGVLRAWNLEVFRDRLERAGMAGMDSLFQQASGAWSALCYKAEMEAALRTRGMAGFQLLDLQDFPGQGTALVGILDAFMDSKGVITPAAWKQSCNDVVLLLEFPRYTWTSDETFQASLVVANYSGRDIHQPVKWEIRRPDGRLVDQGSFADPEISQGDLSAVGEVRTELNSIPEAARLSIHLSIPGTEYTNNYPIWVYPPASEVPVPDDLLITSSLSKGVLSRLQDGAKVLFFPPGEEVRDHSIPGLFTPDFWNFGMFRGISERLHKPVSPGTMGILTNPEHPLFKAFPTDFHSNWQWFSIIKSSHALILDQSPAGYYPLVQVIDNLERNHKLGLIFEFSVGQGSLLVCMSPLNELTDSPEAVQLYRSLVAYMGSDDFKPASPISPEELGRLF